MREDRGVVTATGALTMAAAVLAFASLARLLFRRGMSDAELCFAIFCASLGMTMLRPWLPGMPDWVHWLVTLGGCATCNVYWLFSRALFRGDGGVGRRHVLAALGIAVLIVVHRVAERAEGGTTGLWTSMADALLTLASSTVLALAFIEALRGWQPMMPAEEKRLRLAFMAVYGTCVLAATLSNALADSVSTLAGVRSSVVATCALSILVFSLWALRVRRRHPWPVALPVADAPAVKTATPEERRLAQSIVRLLEEEQVYREPELRVVDLATRLGTVEYRVSRAITQGLGEDNFNRLVNRYRIAHACRLLADPATDDTVLEICLASGFASLGPFNRAFKAATGCTPSAYRATHRSGVAPAGAHPDHAPV